MPNIMAPSTWTMTAAQLISPTTSQLAAVNAIQTAVASSNNWTVNATGTSTAGYKWLEIKPSNTSSNYKDYRILVVERVNTATNKSFQTNDGGAFNVATNIYLTFAPDGGAAHVTFTPANIETSSEVYVGTRYKNGASTVWHTLTSSWTATWLYSCEGALWFAMRQGSTTMIALGLGHVFTPTGYGDFNTAGVEVGAPGYMKKTFGATSFSGQITTSLSQAFWYGSGTSARSHSGINNNSNYLILVPTQTTDVYYAVNSSITLVPAAIAATQNAIGTGTIVPLLLRNIFWKNAAKTRSVMTSGGSNVGYTLYADDSATVVGNCFLFLNS